MSESARQQQGVASQVLDVIKLTISDAPLDINMDTNLLDELDLDSLMMTTLSLELQDHFNIEIEARDLDLTEIQTVADLVGMVEKVLATHA
jgi:acyl carrier protein